MATGLFVLSYGALVVKVLRRSLPLLKPIKVAWLVKAHEVMGAAGAVLGVAGVAVGLYMVEMAGTGHARILHSLVGFATLACVIVPVATGYAVGRSKGHRAQVRWWHILLGFVGIAVMIAGAVTGWALE
jgi:predicted membrane channel-forming protein YqfA (hemolysin III family)